MNKFQSFLRLCLEEGITPEGYLQINQKNESRFLPEEITKKTFNECVQGALYGRFPRLLEQYVFMQGMSASKVCSGIYQDVHLECPETPLTYQTLSHFVQIHQAGISLSWWFFGIGELVYKDFFMSDLDPAKNLNDYVRNLKFKQGWSNIEAKWFITQIHEKTEKKIIHKVMMRLLAGMPKLSLFPPVPSVLEVYKRLEHAVINFVPPKTCPEWMLETVDILKQTTWKICTLMIVRQGSVSHWRVVEQTPRRKSTRLALVINILFEIYGEQKGLMYYLEVLNKEAQAQGFTDLRDVARGAIWNYTLSLDQQKAI